MILTLSEPSVMMVRARRVESESAEWLALTAVMTAISAVHQKAARALFRFRKLIAAGWHDLSATSRYLPRLAQQGHGAVQRVVVGLFVHMLARQPQKTNWCHGLTAESDTCRLVGQHHCAAENAKWPFFELFLPLATILCPGRPRGSLERVRAVPRALPTAERSTDGPDGARMQSPAWERG